MGSFTIWSVGGTQLDNWRQFIPNFVINPSKWAQLSSLFLGLEINCVQGVVLFDNYLVEGTVNPSYNQ